LNKIYFEKIVKSLEKKIQKATLNIYSLTPQGSKPLFYQKPLKTAIFATLNHEKKQKKLL